jgi:phosphate transport system substrate-binding protein
MSSIGRSRLVSLLVAVGLLVLCLIAAGCRRSPGEGHRSVTIAGSTSVQPFAEMLAEEYAKTYPDRPPINVQGGGSSAGARAALSGTADIGMLSRYPAESESELTPTVIAEDALALIVHPTNPVTGFTKAQIRGIFSGGITDWKEVGGTPGAIHIVSREEGSGTRGAFDELIMEGADVMPRAIVQDSNGAVRETIAGDRMAIGYVSLGLVDDRVKAVKVDGVEASVQNVRTREYALVRPFLFVVKGDYARNARDFVDFVLGDEGRRILADEGLVTPE